MKKILKIFGLTILDVSLAFGLTYGAVTLYQNYKKTATDETTMTTSISSIDASASSAPESFTLGDKKGGYGAFFHPFEMGEPNAYCAEKGGSLLLKKNDKRIPDSNGHKAEILYTRNATISNVCQSIAYMEWQSQLGDSDASNKYNMQEVIWASWQWTDSKNYANSVLKMTDETTEHTLNVNSGGALGRSQQFANMEYLVANNSNTLKLTTTPTTDNDKTIKVVVDQTAKTYTVGPYTVDFSNDKDMTLDGLETLGTLVKNEVVGKNPGEKDSNQFCRGSCIANITFQDGKTTDVHTIIPASEGGTTEAASTKTRLEVLDENGTVLTDGFPEFGKKFYIRYTTTDAEGVVAKIQPEINIAYYKKLAMSATQYKSSTVTYRDHEDSGNFIREVATMDHCDVAGSIASNWYIVSKSSYTEGSILDKVINSIKSYIVSENGSSIASVKGLTEGLYCNGTYYDGAAKGSVAYFAEKDGSHKYTTGEHTGDWVPDKDEDGNDLATSHWDRDAGDLKEFDADNVRAVVTINGTRVYQGTPHTSDNSGSNWSAANDEAVRWATDNIHSAVCVPPDNPEITEVNFGMQVQVIPGDVTPTPTPIRPPVTPVKGKTGDTGSPTDNPDAGFAAVVLAEKDIDMYLGGNVWESVPDTKTGTGIKSDSSTAGAGIEVTLVDNNNGTFVSIMTDSKGNYGFKKLNPMHKYYVKFRYNGMQYIKADGTDVISDPGGGVTASETDRSTVDSRFATISASNGNYDGQSKKAFGYYTKLKNGDEYVGWSNVVESSATNSGALRYCDALYVLKEACKNKTAYNLTSKKTMDSTYCDITKKTKITYADYEGALESGIGGISDASSVWTYMMDTLVTSKTNKTYPVEDKYVLEEVGDTGDSHLNATVLGVRDVYRTDQDEARRVDYGIKLRETSDLALQKDVYKAEVIVNGKQQTYYYGKKNTDANWEIEARAADSLYNGEQSYGREVRKSEYLYDGSTSGSSDAKNLQVYVTYRIAVKNQGMVSTNVDEIVDYYDSEYYEYASGSSITQTNTFVGDSSGNNIGSLSVGYGSKCSSSKSSVGPYTAIYLSGLPGLNPGDLTFAYITFKVKIDDSTGKIKINEDLENGSLKRGDRNIAEINQYTTGASKGIVDVDSNPGSLTTRDLDSEGDIITDRNSAVNNRWEDDIDKAPNVIVYIPKNDTDMLNLNGYVYEDARTNVQDGAVVGNGKYSSSDGDTKINGVTVELVELVQDVDSDGLSLGTYSGEHVWSSTTYKLGDLKADPTIDLTRYYSGKKSGDKVYSQVILSGDSGILRISPTELNGDGAYGFTSVPTGDFFIRFVYGDTTQTTLTNGSNSTNNLLQQLKSGDISSDNNINVATNNANYSTLSDGFISTTGLNAKSYNGQDYKSTVYQSGISQSTSYNGHVSYKQGSSDGNATINGYTNYTTQNYTNSDGITKNNGTDKSSMYYYDIAASDNGNGASDAKDVYAYRQNSDNWSTGYNGNSLVNNRAEILDSFENVQTYKDNDDYKNAVAQKNMIKTLMTNTRMVAQTGLIDTEVERNRKETENQADALKNKSDLNNSGSQGNQNSLPYTISDIDLGLTERPEAQLKLTKKVTNFKITLANGQSLFDTKQSVNNLYYAKHTGHIAQYDDEATDKSQPNKLSPRGFRLSNVQTSKNSKETPELIQGYIDDELMEGSTMTVEYTLNIENVGEIDYLDKQFYYTGKTNNTSESNISRTDASTVIDYVSNMIKYDKNYQNSGANWKINTPSDIYQADSKGAITNTSIDKELVNRQYYDKVVEYNTILTTADLSVNKKSEFISNQRIDNTWGIKSTFGLLPECIKNLSSGSDVTAKTSTTTTLVLSTLLSSNNGANSLVYNNLAEVVETVNSQGRRMKYSISGNQEMAEQSLGSNASTEVSTSVDLVTPSEIDADSAQKILLLPPTGENKNVVEIIIIVIAGLVIIAGAITIIKLKVLRKK